jgi:hypothetical protein
MRKCTKQKIIAFGGIRTLWYKSEKKYCFEFPFGLNGKLYLVYLVSCQSLKALGPTFEDVPL